MSSKSSRPLYFSSGYICFNFAAIMTTYFVSCEGFDYGTNQKVFPIHSRKVIEFHLFLLLVPFALRNLFTLYIYIFILLVRSVVVAMFLSCFFKSIFF